MDNKGRIDALLAPLKACAKQKDIRSCYRIHLQLLLLLVLHDGIATVAAAGDGDDDGDGDVDMWLRDEDNIRCLGNSIVSFYAKCREFEKAEEAMECFGRDLVTWNALMSGYVQVEGGEMEVIRCLGALRREGHSPNAITFVCVLKACSRLRIVEKGMQIHGEIIMTDEEDMYVSTALVHMYAKCGMVAEARGLFDRFHVRNVVSWTAMIAGYVEQDCGHEAALCFTKMEHEGVSPNAATFVCVLKAFGSIRASGKGKEIHDEVLRQQPWLLEDILLGTALVDMYAKCGMIADAHKVFDGLQASRNVVCWNALITGHVQHGWNTVALKSFDQMQCEGVPPNAFTFVCILKACGATRAVTKGKSIHAEIVRADLVDKDISLGAAVVDMYAKCGELLRARTVFYQLPARNVVGWSSLIAGYTEQGNGEEAFSCFDRMQCEGLSADAVTFLCVLKTCSSCMRLVDKGKQIHAGILTTKLLDVDSFLGNALVDMYAKCGAMEIAREVFDRLDVQNVVSWTTLIGGYAQHELSDEALNYFERMPQAGFTPNEVTFLAILKVCGTVGALDKGRQMHTGIVANGLLETHISIGSALVDMYGKCGAPAKAAGVFKQLPVQNVASWNAMIAAYAQVGEDNVSVRLFSTMVESIQPDIVTFTILLNMCSHSGSVDKGQDFFSRMMYFGIIPTLEHYTCVVDLFGRAGLVEKAIALINSIPIFDHLPMWVSLLGACQKWGNIQLGRLAFQHAVKIDEEHPALYVYLSNILAGSVPVQDVMEWI